MGQCWSTHWPCTQTPPPVHARPHAPQFAGSVRRSTQPPSQVVQLVAASVQPPSSHVAEPAQPLNDASRSRAVRFIMAFGHASARQ